MIARQIGIVLCRVGAAVLTVQAIRSLGYSIPGVVFGEGERYAEYLALVLLSVTPGLAAIGLWTFAGRISTLPGHESAMESHDIPTGLDIARIGTALIGLCFVVVGITTGASVEIIDLLQPELGPEYQRLAAELAAKTMGARLSYLLQILLGLAFFFGRDRISAMLVRMKYAGTRTQ